MALGYDGNLYILAFDHRGSFQKKMFGIQGDPSPKEADTIIDAKRLIFEGFRKAIAEGGPKGTGGILIDEQFGADAAREAKSEGMLLAMPVEKSGQNEFDFQYDDDFGAHIEEFDPSFSKVLVRWNPEGDAGLNERQGKRLATLGEWLHEHDRKFLFELLVPAEPQQLEAVDGDGDRYDRELRPQLMADAIRQLRDAGVEPDIWKIEGIDERRSCERIAELVRTGGRDGVVCVVLGRGADDAAVDHWLKQGAGVPGYVGFAIGRTIWWDALKGYLDGSVDRDEAAKRISENYRRFIDVYQSAEAG
ncbi:MAG: 2-deoxy-5-keto-D-gluconate 6-phosphate aldolase domain-containing protein [Actinomycetota bacterium]